MLAFLNQWGSLIGLIGAVLSLVGLIAAVVAAFRAKRAEEAATAARQETWAAITRSLTTVDLERAMGLVQRLKEIHRSGRWEVSLALYQELRILLSNVRSRHPAPTPELQEELGESILLTIAMENSIDSIVERGSGPSEMQWLNTMLSYIEASLLDISDAIRAFHAGNE